MRNKYSVILGNLGNTRDRFLSSGYKEQPSQEELFRLASSIDGVGGVELVGSWDITSKNVTAVRALLNETGLECVGIIPDHFSQKVWAKGAFTSHDPAIRERATAHTKEMMDAAAELDCPLINIWAGQDGYDYSLQADFDQASSRLVEALRECADYRPDIKLSLEFKPKEPRNFSFLSRSSDTLLTAIEVERTNVGVTIDTGHAFVGGENLGECVARLSRYGRLFHMHFNDNYGSWDDDMVVGSVHHVAFVELLYWLRRTGYDGWYSMDQYPYREDGAKALSASIRTLEKMEEAIEEFGEDCLTEILKSGDALEAVRAMRSMLFGS